MVELTKSEELDVAGKAAFCLACHALDSPVRGSLVPVRAPGGVGGQMSARVGGRAFAHVCGCGCARE